MDAKTGVNIVEPPKIEKKQGLFIGFVFIRVEIPVLLTKKLIEKPKESHSHKPQPTRDIKRKRKMKKKKNKKKKTNTNKVKR